MAIINDLWKALKPEPFCPHPNQEKAILHTEGPVYLPAGPGAGKTRVLLWRTVNLIAFQNVRPEDIFLATFTEKAALQLKEGLRSLLDIASEITGVPYDTSRVYVGTAHSLCQRILTDHRFSKGAEHRFSPVLLDELSQYLYLYRRFRWDSLTEEAGLKKHANSRINEIFSGKKGNGSSSRHRAVSSCMGVFNRLTEECVDVEAAIRRMTNRDVKLLLKLCSIYQESMESDSVTDFANIQRKALERLDKSYSEENAFRYVIVDEYQDTNTIQERFYFKLASIHKNLCVVGDDDQALYRFRGATVENFVEFPERCREFLGQSPTKIPLSINYRSRKGIVEFCNKFISHSSCDWEKKSNKGFYRVPKEIKANRTGDDPAVIATQPGDLENVCKEVASMVKAIVREGRLNDPNEIAFLFPSLKTKQAAAMKDALIAMGLKVYAPRAGRLLEVHEAKAIFGLFLLVFGRPSKGDGFGYQYEEFHSWLDEASREARKLVQSDNHLKRFLQLRRSESIRAARDYERLRTVCEQRGWGLEVEFDTNVMQPALMKASAISPQARRLLGGSRLAELVKARKERGPRPISLHGVLARVASLDWSLLDLFYQISYFPYFRAMFDEAESGNDEGPVCNLSLIAQYIGRFIEEYGVSALTGEHLSRDLIPLVFFGSYLFTLHRRGESEFEDANNPFPRGRIPFLTIHQAKGLEFPVVVLGNPARNDWEPGWIEHAIRAHFRRSGEPLDLMPVFDNMRMFYVALSRAKDLLILPHVKIKKSKLYPPFVDIIPTNSRKDAMDAIKSVEKHSAAPDSLPKSYSYTADYLAYLNCPRQYMIFRKYNFPPSRSQTMFVGSLVHQTLEDLHRFLLRRKSHEAKN